MEIKGHQQRKHKISDLNQIRTFSIDFYKSPQYKKISKIHTVEATVLHVDRLTVDMMKLIGDLHEYANVPKITVYYEIRSHHGNRYEKSFLLRRNDV